jgi:hypothetical protein
MAANSGVAIAAGPGQGNRDIKISLCRLFKALWGYKLATTAFLKALP